MQVIDKEAMQPMQTEIGAKRNIFDFIVQRENERKREGESDWGGRERERERERRRRKLER